ncbi:hypothetical protein MRB53_041372 [Persea americana]|nr:hypothetical protein MRB53_041372 [Persea americana]
MKRQLFRTHRSFTAHIMDIHGSEVLRLHRPLRTFPRKFESMLQIRRSLHPSSLQRYGYPTAEMQQIGEAQQDEKKVTIDSAKFASVDEPFLSWDFTLRDKDGHTVGSVNRNFGGFAREIFTDTGAYALRMDASAFEHQTPAGQQQSRVIIDRPNQAPAMTLDQRAVMLATSSQHRFRLLQPAQRACHRWHGIHADLVAFWRWCGGRLRVVRSLVVLWPDLLRAEGLAQPLLGVRLQLPLKQASVVRQSQQAMKRCNEREPAKTRMPRHCKILLQRPMRRRSRTKLLGGEDNSPSSKGGGDAGGDAGGGGGGGGVMAAVTSSIFF